MRRSWLLSTPGALVVASALAAAQSVQAEGLPLLTVHRTDDALGCPDARALAALVAKQMKRPALQPAGQGPRGADRGLDVQIYRSERGFTAVIQAKGKTRQLSDRDATCRSLAEALAVSITVLLDTDPLPPEPEQLPPPPAPPPPVAPPSRPPEPPSAVTDTPEPLPVEDLGRVTSHGVLMVAPVITLGLLQSWSMAILSELDVRFGRFSIAGGVLILPGQPVAGAPGSGSLDLTAGLLRACATAVEREALRLALCLMSFAGSVRLHSMGLPAGGSSTTTVPWAAAGTGALFEQRIWGPFSWGVRADLVIPFVKSAFTMTSFDYNPAPAAGMWDVEFRVAIW